MSLGKFSYYMQSFTVIISRTCRLNNIVQHELNLNANGFFKSLLDFVFLENNFTSDNESNNLISD